MGEGDTVTQLHPDVSGTGVYPTPYQLCPSLTFCSCSTPTIGILWLSGLPLGVCCRRGFWWVLSGGRAGLKDGWGESGHLGLGRVQSLTQIFSLTGRSAGTTPGPNGAGIDFPAWGGGAVTGNSPPWTLYLASQDMGGSIAHSRAQPALSKS